MSRILFPFGVLTMSGNKPEAMVVYVVNVVSVISDKFYDKFVILPQFLYF